MCMLDLSVVSKGHTISCTNAALLSPLSGGVEITPFIVGMQKANQVTSHSSAFLPVFLGNRTL